LIFFIFFNFPLRRSAFRYILRGIEPLQNFCLKGVIWMLSWIPAVLLSLILIAAWRWRDKLMQERENDIPLQHLNEEALHRLHQALEAYAQSHEHHFPEHLEEVETNGSLPKETSINNYTYRPIPSDEYDPRLVLLYTRYPLHKIVEYPYLKNGRLLMFLGGQSLLLPEEDAQKRLLADNILRERLGLHPLGLEV